MFGELELRKRLFRENQAKDCQEIEELKRICCKETDRARKASVDELSLHQERNPTAVSQLLTQIQDLQSKVIPLQTQESFPILKQRAASGATHVPNQPPHRVPGPCLAAILDCRMIHGTSWVLQETSLNDYLLEKDEPLLSENSKNLATSSHELRPDILRNTKRSEREMRREPQNSSILAPRFQRGAGVYDHTGATYSV